MALNWKFVSLGTKYPRKLTPASERRSPKFKKTWERVLSDLEYETDKLNARDGSVVILTFHTPRDVTVAGRLRGDAKQPQWPGVVVKFDVPSEDRQAWDPMSFECDQFTTWQANVQAVTAALEALRMIDRYGVSSRGQEKAHYAGYKALPSAEGKATSRTAAAEFIAKHSGVDVKEILFSETALSTAYRRAVQKLHPDKTNDVAEFAKLTEAKKILDTLKETASTAGGGA